MKNQVQRLACGLMLTSLMGCGVTTEVAAHHPNTSVVPGPGPAAPGGERPAQVPSRPGAPHPAVAKSPAAASVSLAAITARRPAPRATTLPTSRAEATPELAIGSPNRRIQSGRIIDEAGQPLVGATVLLKGTTRGTSTDANGDYALPVPLGNNTFVVAYTGYQEEVAQSRDGQPLTVTLLPIPGLAPAEPTVPAPKKKLSLPGSRAHKPKE